MRKGILTRKNTREEHTPRLKSHPSQEGNKPLHFFCYDCKHYFLSETYKLDRKLIHQTYKYYSKCPLCGAKTYNVGHSFANLEKMHENAPGPQTIEGKKISSMNAFRTGMHAKKINRLAPARFGKYLQCENCEYAEMCEIGNLKYCPVNLGTMLRFVAAYQEGRVEELKEFAGIAQGNIQFMIEQITKEIFEEGLSIETLSKTGVKEYKSNPLIKSFGDLMQVAGYTSDQQQMNPRAETEKDKILEGNLDKETGIDYISRLSATIANAIKNLPQANKERSADPNLDKTGEELEKEKVNFKDVPEESPF